MAPTATLIPGVRAIEYGGKASNNPPGVNSIFAFNGARGDRVEIAWGISNAKPSVAVCASRVASTTARVNVTYGLDQPLKPEAAGTGPRADAYVLPHTGTYYINASCQGPACSICGELEIALSGPTQSAAAAVPATSIPGIPTIQYGEKVSYAAQGGGGVYTFQGNEGDRVAVTAGISNSKPNLPFCVSRMAGSSVSIGVETADGDEVAVWQRDSAPNTDVFRLPATGTYYLKAACSGGACTTRCGDISIELNLSQ